MVERTINARLDCTTLTVYIVVNHDQGEYVESSASVDLTPAMRAIFRAGQQDMQKRAVDVADPAITWQHGALSVDPWKAAKQVTREIRSAIAALEIRDE